MEKVESLYGAGDASSMQLETAVSLSGTLRKPFLDRLENLYASMDRRYQEVAEGYRFHCDGCEDSCCKTTFYHHTLVEYLYLREGVFSLEKEKQGQILHLSKEVSANPNAGRFCPLNEDERCILYSNRPMICRLHGLAHELIRPDGTALRGSGCSAFEAAARGKPYLALDRTEFYWELSKLEKDARQALGVSRKIKMTISRMVETMLSAAPEGKFPS